MKIPKFLKIFIMFLCVCIVLAATVSMSFGVGMGLSWVIEKLGFSWDNVLVFLLLFIAVAITAVLARDIDQY